MTPRSIVRPLLLACVLLIVMPAGHARVSAHVGSPDVYFDGRAGAYRVLVAVRAPAVVPGVAEIEVRVLDGAPREVRVVPLRLTGPGAVFAPVPDRATPSASDPRFFTANLWMMTAGPWQVRVAVDGDAGSGQVAIPVDALASRTLRMDPTLAMMLLPVGLFLVFGFIALVGASVGQAQADPGQPTPPQRVRRARVARAFAFVAVLAILGLGNWWWALEAEAYDAYIYKPLQLTPTLEADGRLRLALRDPGWLRFRVIDDLVPDHGHPMHLFAVRMPALDRLLHLHPEAGESPGSFVQRLPSLAPGKYRLFADVVHATGLPETAVADLTPPVPATAPATALAGDDSEATAPADGAFQFDRTIAELPGGGRMTWVRGSGALKAKQPYLLTFRVDNADGSPARDLTLYMGMPGHAIVLRKDLSVFAHVHPSGTAAMASLALSAATLPGAPTSPLSAPDPHAQHMAGHSSANTAPLPATVTFPYGFPRAGDYRVFVQVRRNAGVQTGVFDVRVE